MTGRRPPTAGFLHDQPNPPARSRGQPAPPTAPGRPWLDRGEHRHTIRPGGTRPEPGHEPPRPNDYHPSQPNLLHRQPESKGVSGPFSLISGELLRDSTTRVRGEQLV